MDLERVPLLIKIGLWTTGPHKRRGQGKYPDLDKVPEEIRKGMGWVPYTAKFATGPFYDKCGHAQHESDVPIGTWQCVFLVEEAFADEAVKLFPDEVSRLTPKQFVHYYETRCSDSQGPDQFEDFEALKIVLSLDAMVEQKIITKKFRDDHRRKALDPEEDCAGICRNKDKHWDGSARSKGIKLK